MTIESTGSGLAPRFIIADPRKFSHYVLDPANADRKDHIFVSMLGYRPHHQEDAHTLSATYIEQAMTKIAASEYEMGKRDKYGQDTRSH